MASRRVRKSTEAVFSKGWAALSLLLTACGLTGSAEQNRTRAALYDVGAPDVSQTETSEVAVPVWPDYPPHQPGDESGPDDSARADQTSATVAGGR